MKTYEVSDAYGPGGDEQKPWGRVAADERNRIVKFEPLDDDVLKDLFDDEIAARQTVSAMSERMRTMVFDLTDEDEPQDNPVLNALYHARRRLRTRTGEGEVAKGEGT